MGQTTATRVHMLPICHKVIELYITKRGEKNSESKLPLLTSKQHPAAVSRGTPAAEILIIPDHLAPLPVVSASLASSLFKVRLGEYTSQTLQ